MGDTGVGKSTLLNKMLEQIEHRRESAIVYDPAAKSCRGIFGYQGKAELEVIYGHLAEVMLSMPSTKIVMKTSEPNAAKWASDLIGEIEIERVRETVADGKRAREELHLGPSD